LPHLAEKGGWALRVELNVGSWAGWLPLILGRGEMQWILVMPVTHLTIERHGAFLVLASFVAALIHVDWSPLHQITGNRAVVDVYP